MSKIYTVYDEDNKIIYNCTSRDELLDKFKIASSCYIYSKGFFLPNKKCESKIRVNIANGKIISKKTTPAVSDDLRFNNRQLSFIKKLPAVNISLSTLKPVKGYPYHYASKYGHVYVEYEPGKIVQCSENIHTGRTKQYYHVSLYTKNKPCTDAVLSRVIASAWLDTTLDIDYSKDKRVVDHIDDKDTLNNRIENLQILTQSENLIKALDSYGDTYRLKYCYIYDGMKKRFYPFNSTILASTWIKAQDEKGLPEDYKPNAGIFAKLRKEHGLSRGRYTVGYTKEECLETWEKHNSDIVWNEETSSYTNGAR